MGFKVLAALAAPAILLSACATNAPMMAARQTTSSAAEAGRSPYGMFLAGQSALNAGDSEKAARYFDMARLSGDGDSSEVDERAFSAALLAGDISKAAALAPTAPETSEAVKRLAALTVGVELLAEGKAKAAQTELGSTAIGFPHRSAAVLLAPWAAAAAGDVEASLIRPQAPGDKMVDYFGQLAQGMLYERAKRFDEAETDFKAVTSGAQPAELAISAYGAFLERRGRRLDAVALYDAALARNPDSLSLVAAKQRAAAGKAAPQPLSIREGAAQALLAPAATMVQARQSQLALAYLRMTLRLDPKRDDAWLMVGDLMAVAGDQAAARAAYAKPRPGTSEHVVAQVKLAWTYQNGGDKAEALRLARAAAAEGGEDQKVNLADLLRANEQYDEAVQILTQVINSQGAKPDWRLLYARGVSQEELGAWKDAEKDLQAALALQPEDAELLNYLGYMWIDRGEHVKEGMAMVQKAVGTNPRSGPMVDSLGWAYYRLGDYKMAVQKLEEAVELEAGDPEINGHLGDAYWKAGRQDEARFQWRRVLTLDPDAKMKEETERKLASPDGPPQKVAGQ
jgi:tetratricopeptide (TPR) repeat protein